MLRQKKRKRTLRNVQNAAYETNLKFDSPKDGKHENTQSDS